MGAYRGTFEASMENRLISPPWGDYDEKLGRPYQVTLKLEDQLIIVWIALKHGHTQPLDDHLF